uniref:UTP23 small subunit processome component n=1 Tax=Aotus nancymaae TaxID=37293 RepID=A0A2K5EWI5_AOTNA
MKITRQKHAKKHLGFFRNNFGVREPYQILLDGTFCQAALRGRIQLREQLPRYLMGEKQLCTTRCNSGSLLMGYILIQSLKNNSAVKTSLAKLKGDIPFNPTILPFEYPSTNCLSPVSKAIRNTSY